MKIHIDSIRSAGIRAEMRRDSCTTAELLGTYSHPTHNEADWVIRLYRAADALVFGTNGDPVWEGIDGFAALAEEYGVNIDEVAP